MSSSIQAIIERQMRNWELARRQTPPRVEEELPEQMKPFVSVSRQLGSGGAELAALLAKRLGWRVYDKEILDYMAGEDEVQRRIYALHDERHAGWLSSIMDALSPEKTQRRDDYFHKLARALCAIVENENAVILGRGSQFLLPPDRGVCIRVVAPLAVCCSNLAERESISLADAEVRVRREGQERETFLKAHFVPEPWAGDYYDLIINMGGISLDAAVRIVLTTLEAKTGVKP